MTTTIEPTPDINAATHDETLRRTVRAKTLRGRPRVAKATAMPDLLTPDERKIIDDLNAELPREFWLRYNAHFDKLDAARRGKAEYTKDDEAVGLRFVEKIADVDARRLQAVIQMAQRRGANPADFWKRLNLGHHPDSDAGRKRL